MRIMFCINSLGYGGAEKSLCTVANGLAARGHEIWICNFNESPTTQIIDAHIHVIDAPMFNRRGMRRLQQLRYMMKLCKEEKPELLVSFLTIPNFLTAIVGKLTGIPTIISERGDPYVNTGLAAKLLYSAYRLAKGAVFQTEGAKNYFGKSLQRKGTVIPNPVVLKDDTVRADHENCKKSIAYAARFETRQKRQDLMVEAFRLVHERRPDYRLDFYGDGPDEDAIRQLTKNLGLESSVVFHGVSHRLLQNISQSEMFVLSSDYEGIPNSLIEAMSIGLPCVSTDCSPGGARMLIEDGINGLMVPRGDAAALAAAVCRMIENREFAIECGRKAMKIKERFALSNILDKWEAYCRKIAEK